MQFSEAIFHLFSTVFIDIRVLKGLCIFSIGKTAAPLILYLLVVEIILISLTSAMHLMIFDIYLFLKCGHFVFRNDLTQQITQINHRIDNLAQQINNNKYSPSASNLIQKLKNDVEKELILNNGVSTTEDSALQQNRLFIDKEGKLSFQNNNFTLDMPNLAS